jgi:hypothetical protein
MFNEEDANSNKPVSIGYGISNPFIEKKVSSSKIHKDLCMKQETNRMLLSTPIHLTEPSRCETLKPGLRGVEIDAPLAKALECSL